jgi:hypothetical protein
MNRKVFIFLLLMATVSNCVVEFFPTVDEGKDFLVVEGLITDQNRPYSVRITRASRLGPKNTISPVKDCVVSVTDDLGNISLFKEWKNGYYFSDSLTFRGEAGRKYILQITDAGHIFESDLMEMKSVPTVDSLYAVLEYNNTYSLGKTVPGYQVYLNTSDPSDECKFYRWSFEETWEFRIPYVYPTIINRICWKYGFSDKLYLKNVSALKENRITAYPLNFITTETDRLKARYSILVNQYSLNEDEYIYWEKLQKTTQNVGGLYDVVPMSIKGNMHCIDSPDEMVLGYFSVSSVASERIFIKNTLIDFPNFYGKCPVDTVHTDEPISGLNSQVWIIAFLNDVPNDDPPPPLANYYVLTNRKECIDCTLNGSKIMPPYWDQPGKNTFTHTLFNEK